MKITAVETIHLPEYPSILFVAVHTDDGLIGYSDTCYMPDAVAGFIHGFAAPMLIGHDALAIELHWRRLYEVMRPQTQTVAEYLLSDLPKADLAKFDHLVSDLIARLEATDEKGRSLFLERTKPADEA